jgi:WD40 repeat protein
VFGCKKGKPLAAIDYHTQSVRSVAFGKADSEHSNLIICGSKDERVSLWKLY